MAINYPGPYGLRMFYTTSVSSVVLTHMAEYNIDCRDTPPDPGDPFSAITLKARDGSFPNLDDYVEGWVTLFKALYNSGANHVITYAELWRYTAGTFDADFISTYDISDAGTSGSATVAAGQQVLSFRTLEGGTLKLNLMESINVAGAPVLYPALSAALKAIVDFVLSADNGFLGRDTSYPFAFVAGYPGQNEALFKRRYRP